MTTDQLRIIGWIDSLCDGCAYVRHCNVIETPEGTAIVCDSCKGGKYPGVE